MAYFWGFVAGQWRYGIQQTILRAPWDFSYLSWHGWSYTFQSLPGFSAIAFSPDGSSLFGLEEKDDRVIVHRYSLLPWGSTDPWNLLNAIKLVGSYEVSPVRGSPVGLLVSDDGRYVYAFVTFAETSTITQFKV
ncbi:MAG: hypothetical protein HQL84_17705 [Magnetococcales bacterium]|nr:hypothetical protein [Magnetococcales bacterium]MBF0151856.1 hypothetical protein [Magnetococcales bacterium]